MKLQWQILLSTLISFNAFAQTREDVIKQGQKRLEEAFAKAQAQQMVEAEKKKNEPVVLDPISEYLRAHDEWDKSIRSWQKRYGDLSKKEDEAMAAAEKISKDEVNKTRDRLYQENKAELKKLGAEIQEINAKYKAAFEKYNSRFDTPIVGQSVKEALDQNKAETQKAATEALANIQKPNQDGTILKPEVAPAEQISIKIPEAPVSKKLSDPTLLSTGTPGGSDSTKKAPSSSARAR